jgi:hypothetical protein
MNDKFLSLLDLNLKALFEETIREESKKWLFNDFRNDG